MQLVRFAPTGDMLNFGNGMNSLFENFFGPAERAGNIFSKSTPKVDIYNDDDKIVLKADLPGMDKKDIEIGIKGKCLTIKGEIRTENEKNRENYYCRERTCGKFERSFTLPGEVKSDAVKADYKNGILEIEIKKPEENKVAKISVQ